MGKTRRHNRYFDDYEDFEEDQKFRRERNRRDSKKLKHSVREQNLKYVEEKTDEQ